MMTLEGLMYELTAAERHRPIAIICSVVIPHNAADVAAPILKLCGLKFSGGKPIT